MPALLLTLFKVQKQKAAKAAQEKTELEEGGYIDGPSHKQGGVRVGNTNTFVEGGEFVVKKKVTSKNRAFLHAFNSGLIEQMHPYQVLSMLNPKWASLAGMNYDRTMNKQIDMQPSPLPPEFFSLFEEFFGVASDYYANAPRELAAPLAPGIIKYTSKNGTRIEIEKAYVKND